MRHLAFGSGLLRHATVRGLGCRTAIHAQAMAAEEVLQLRKLARKNTPAQVIARKLGRSIDAVYVKASREGLSLRLVPEQELLVSQS